MENVAAMARCQVPWLHAPHYNIFSCEWSDRTVDEMRNALRLCTGFVCVSVCDKISYAVAGNGVEGDKQPLYRNHVKRKIRL